MSYLSVENICYKYRKNDRFILDEFSYSFELGKTYAVVGKSGSGKSTLLSILAGFDMPTKGQIVLEGNPITKENIEAYRKQNISYIFQDYQLFPKLTIIENVIMPLQLNGQAKDKSRSEAENILLKMGIDDSLWDRYPSQLSGGEQQRVAISRALALGGKLVLADEPTGNLDPDNSRKTLEILQKLASEENMCVIIVTHDSILAGQCDETIHLEKR